MAQRIIDSPALADYWRAVDSDVPSMRAARETVRDLLEEPIARAKTPDCAVPTWKRRIFH